MKYKPDNKSLVFLISDDKDNRHHLSNFKEHIQVLTDSINEDINTINEEIKKNQKKFEKKFATRVHASLLTLQSEKKFATRIHTKLSNLRIKLRYIGNSFFNRWIEKFKNEQINDFHYRRQGYSHRL